MKKLAMFLIVMTFLLISVQSAFAVTDYCKQGLPQFFSGTLTINGADAPIGSQVRGLVETVVGGTRTTTVLGQIGTLAVSGDSAGYDYIPTVNFEVYVDGAWVDSGESAPFVCGAETLVNIDVDYQDSDGDGFQVGDDCDDNDADVYPGAPELCNGIDNDCDVGTADGSGEAWYGNACDGIDSDLCNEGTLGCSAGVQTCSDSTGNNLDVCNGLDDDCDAASTDGSEEIAPLNFLQAGVCSGSTKVCAGVVGWLDDYSGIVTYNQPEITCDGLDNDCDGADDEGLLTTFYLDSDGDLFGNAASTQDACSAPLDYVADNTDCDDADAAVNPAATEVCDGVDNDCDGAVDEGVKTTFYQDSDGDLFGNAASTQDACSAPLDYVADNTDCNDVDASVNPAALEVVDDAVDQDCNGFDSVTCFVDSDQDGYGTSSFVVAVDGSCDTAQGESSNSNDCDDADADVNPAALEVCDGVDNNCDGNVDEGLLTTFYLDSDGDVFGNAASTQDACSAPQGYVADNTDCDDADAAINPVATEICDGVDNDCDGNVDEDGVCVVPDSDGDGVPDDQDVCQGFDDNVDTDADAIPDGCDSCTDVDVDGFCAEENDCNDGNAAVNPDAVEVCDAVDNNCNAQIDENQVCDAIYPVSITIYDGWSLFALPFDPVGISNTEELGQAIMADTGLSCDVMMMYDGATQLMVDDILGLGDPSFALAGTEGYFIHCDGPAVFNYNGVVWE